MAYFTVFYVILIVISLSLAIAQSGGVGESDIVTALRGRGRAERATAFSPDDSLLYILTDVPGFIVLETTSGNVVYSENFANTSWHGLDYVFDFSLRKMWLVSVPQRPDYFRTVQGPASMSLIEFDLVNNLTRIQATGRELNDIPPATFGERWGLYYTAVNRRATWGGSNPTFFYVPERSSIYYTYSSAFSDPARICFVNITSFGTSTCSNLPGNVSWVTNALSPVISDSRTSVFFVSTWTPVNFVDPCRIQIHEIDLTTLAVLQMGFLTPNLTVCGTPVMIKSPSNGNLLIAYEEQSYTIRFFTVNPTNFSDFKSILGTGIQTANLPVGLTSFLMNPNNASEFLAVFTWDSTTIIKIVLNFSIPTSTMRRTILPNTTAFVSAVANSKRFLILSSPRSPYFTSTYPIRLTRYPLVSPEPSWNITLNRYLVSTIYGELRLSPGKALLFGSLELDPGKPLILFTLELDLCTLNVSKRTYITPPSGLSFGSGTVNIRSAHVDPISNRAVGSIRANGGFYVYDLQNGTLLAYRNVTGSTSFVNFIDISDPNNASIYVNEVNLTRYSVSNGSVIAKFPRVPTILETPEVDYLNKQFYCHTINSQLWWAGYYNVSTEFIFGYGTGAGASSQNYYQIDYGKLFVVRGSNRTAVYDMKNPYLTPKNYAWNYVQGISVDVEKKVAFAHDFQKKIDLLNATNPEDITFGVTTTLDAGLLSHFYLGQCAAEGFYVFSLNDGNLIRWSPTTLTPKVVADPLDYLPIDDPSIPSSLPPNSPSSRSPSSVPSSSMPSPTMTLPMSPIPTSVQSPIPMSTSVPQVAPSPTSSSSPSLAVPTSSTSTQTPPGVQSPSPSATSNPIIPSPSQASSVSSPPAGSPSPSISLRSPNPPSPSPSPTPSPPLDASTRFLSILTLAFPLCVLAVA